MTELSERADRYSVIKADSVEFIYKNISLCINKGEFISLMGASDSGEILLGG